MGQWEKKPISIHKNHTSIYKDHVSIYKTMSQFTLIAYFICTKLGML